MINMGIQDDVNAQIIEQLEKQVADLEQEMSQKQEVKTQPKWKSKVVWISLLPVVLVLGDTYGLWDVIGMPKNTFVQLLTSLGAMMTAFGVWNSPEKTKEF